MFSSPDSEYVAWRAERRLLAQRCARCARSIDGQAAAARPTTERGGARRLASLVAHGLVARVVIRRRPAGGTTPRDAVAAPAARADG